VNTNINELIKKLPDYEDFMTLAETIERLSTKKARIEIQLKTLETELVRKVTTDPAFFQGGKVPSMAYIDGTWKYTGLNNELVPLRIEYAELTSSLEKSKITMEVYKTMLDIWRTLSANERKASL